MMRWGTTALLLELGFLVFAGLAGFVLWRAFFRWRSAETSVRRETKILAVAAGSGVFLLAAMLITARVYDEIDSHLGNAGRFATRQGRTIQLHPSGITFQVPEEWLEWDSEFHNNFHLTHRELRKVRLGSGEWDWEYGKVVNAVLPFEHCAVHAGGEGWGTDGSSFGDLQLRAYVTDLSVQEVLARAKRPGFSTARDIAKSGGFTVASAAFSISKYGVWDRATIDYPLWYGDYGGTGVVDFYVKDEGPYRLVLLFMGQKDDEKESILESVSFQSKR